MRNYQTGLKVSELIEILKKMKQDATVVSYHDGDSYMVEGAHFSAESPTSDDECIIELGIQYDY